MSPFDWSFPFPSQRMPVLARNVVATSQPLAAQAGLRMLLEGGNAVDAALAAAIALTVVEPTSNGIGSDAFAILWDGQELHGLNASGRSPAGLTRDRFAGQEAMPKFGWDAVTVPGAVSAWVEVSRRFGRLPFGKLFEPAIRYAAEGFPVSPITASAWAEYPDLFRDFPEFGHAFLPNGRAPLAGEIFSQPDQARTLSRIAETEGEAFYRGDLAAKMAEHARRTGGLMTEDDLAEHRPDWVGTLSSGYRGATLHEIPPNGQGLAALLMLGILEHFPLADFPADSADSIHLQLEAMKLAFADAERYIADPETMEVQPRQLLHSDYLKERSRLISMREARHPIHGVPPASGTVLLAAADEEGRMVSFIQSNFWGFGSGVVVPGTGIALQNRGFGFTLESGHPNEVGPRKRPFHTIIPAFMTEAGDPRMAFGVMGGSMQAQGHGQMMIRIRDYGFNPQAASDAPRWRIMADGSVLVEPGIAPDVRNELTARGHRIKVGEPSAFGGAQLVYRLDSGAYVAGSDSRKDGQAVGY